MSRLCRGRRFQDFLDARFVIKHPMQTEFADIWQTLSDEQRAMLEAQPHAKVYQIVAKADYR